MKEQKEGNNEGSSKRQGGVTELQFADPGRPRGLPQPTGYPEEVNKRELQHEGSMTLRTKQRRIAKKDRHPYLLQKHPPSIIICKLREKFTPQKSLTNAPYVHKIMDKNQKTPLSYYFGIRQFL